MLKRLLCGCLCAALMLGLSGCTNWEDEDHAIPTGRFVEEELPLESSGVLATDFQRGIDGSLYGIFQLPLGEERYDYQLCRMENGVAEPTEADWLAPFDTQDEASGSYERIVGFDFAGEGGYVLTRKRAQGSSNSTAHIYRAAADGWTEITPEDLNWLVNPVLLQQALHSDEEGYYLYSLGEGAIVGYREDGLRITSPYPGQSCFAVTDSHIWTLSPDGREIYRYEKGKADSPTRIPYRQEGLGQMEMVAMTADNKGNLLLADKLGLHRFLVDSEVGETIADGTLLSIGAPSCTVTYLGAESTDSLYVYSEKTGGKSLLHYWFDLQAPVYPEKELVVFSMEESALVREACAWFQRENADVRVNYQCGIEEDTGDEALSREEIIKQLNVAMLSGTGPDVLILDGLNAKSYIESGALLELSGQFGEMVSSGEIKQLIPAEYQPEGKLYMLPMRWTLPLFFGEKLEGEVTLGQLAEQSAQVEDAFLWPVLLENRVRMFYAAGQSEWLLGDEIDGEALAHFLTDLKAVSKASGDKLTLEELTNQTTAIYPDIWRYMDKYLPESLPGEDEAKLVAYQPKVLEQGLISAYAALCGMEGLSCVTLDSILQPSVIAAIPSGGKQTDLALEFVGLLASEELQTVNFSEGLPANSAALAEQWENYVAKGRKSGGLYLSAGSAQGSEQVDIDYPALSDGDIAALQQILNSAAKPVIVNQTVLDILVEEAVPYLHGGAGLEETVAAIKQKAELYLAE